MKSRPLAVLALVLACAEPPLYLGLPESLSNSEFSSAVLLVQEGEEPASSVARAELLALPPTSTRRFEVSSSGPIRLRVLAYEVPPAELSFDPGPLPRATAPDGVPLPPPAVAFVAAPFEEPAMAGWRAIEVLDTAAIPWRLPGQPAGETCPNAETAAWRVEGLELVQPRALLALGPSEAIVAGQWSEPDGETARESLLVHVTQLDSGARFEPLVPPRSQDSYRGLVMLAGRRILASSSEGWLTRVDLGTLEAQTRRVLSPKARWELSLGEDGSIVAFDAQDSALPPGRAHPVWVDPETLEVAPLDAPDALIHVAVVSRQTLYAAGERGLYSYQDSTWTLEHEVAQPVTELLHGGGRVVAVLGRGTVLDRGSDGRWRELPRSLGIFELRTGAVFSDGRVVLGGRGGVLLQHHEGLWCIVPQALTRAVRAMAAFDERTGLAVTYSERAGEQVGITRLSFTPSN